MNLRAVAAVLAATTVHTRHETDPASRADLDRLANRVVTPLRDWIGGLATALDDVDHAVRNLTTAAGGDTARDRLALRDGLAGLKRQLAVLVADVTLPGPRPGDTAADDSAEHPIGRVSR